MESGASQAGPPRLSRGKHAAFLLVTLLVPVLLLAAVELGLRVASPGGGLPLFVEAPFAGDGYRVANRDVARRYFPAEQAPPAPPVEPFASSRPDGGLRVFVLGESSTAGFPYPHNGTFSRVLRDALGDALPGAAVEVVNLGIAATNSFTMVDLIDEVLDQDPGLVIVYGGHNEFYGALGAASTQSGWSSPAVKRAYLSLLRLRTVQVLRSVVTRLRAGAAGGGDAAAGSDAASFMEVLAREQQIELDGATYREGLRQFEENLTLLVERSRAAGVPVMLSSIASNVRDLRPLVSPGNGGPGGADSTYAAASAALAAGDSARARALFVRARDLDVVRFRAPSAANEVIRRVAREHGAVYVPVAERFDQLSGGMPGQELFLEHVHPTQHGQAVIARTVFETMRDSGLLGDRAEPARLAGWDEYERRMALSAFDLRIVDHTLRTLTSRWPFVPAGSERDYRGDYRPTGPVDSLAMAVSRGGMPWAAAKLQVAEYHERAGRPDSAAAEYRGLARDAPFAETPLQLLGRALLASGDTAAGASALRDAFEIEPTAYTSLMLGRMAMERRDAAGAVRYLEAAVRLSPSEPLALYSLSLAYGMSGDVARARAAAERLSSFAPGFPGLAEWRRLLAGGGAGGS